MTPVGGKISGKFASFLPVCGAFAWSVGKFASSLPGSKALVCMCLVRGHVCLILTGLWAFLAGKFAPHPLPPHPLRFPPPAGLPGLGMPIFVGSGYVLDMVCLETKGRQLRSFSKKDYEIFLRCGVDNSGLLIHKTMIFSYVA